jgi:hypothetical protein
MGSTAFVLPIRTIYIPENSTKLNLHWSCRDEIIFVRVSFKTTRRTVIGSNSQHDIKSVFSVESIRSCMTTIRDCICMNADV